MGRCLDNSSLGCDVKPDFARNEPALDDCSKQLVARVATYLLPANLPH